MTVSPTPAARLITRIRHELDQGYAVGMVDVRALLAEYDRRGAELESQRRLAVTFQRYLDKASDDIRAALDGPTGDRGFAVPTKLSDHQSAAKVSASPIEVAERAMFARRDAARDTAEAAEPARPNGDGRYDLDDVLRENGIDPAEADALDMLERISSSAGIPLGGPHWESEIRHLVSYGSLWHDIRRAFPGQVGELHRRFVAERAGSASTPPAAPAAGVHDARRLAHRLDVALRTLGDPHEQPSIGDRLIAYSVIRRVRAALASTAATPEETRDA